jgi:uncharacterized protein (DUF885 family)
MKKLIVFSEFLVLIILFNACAEKSYEELNTLLADDWEFTLKENPLFATSYGDHRFDDKLDDVSLAAHIRRDEQNKKFLDRLNEINYDALSEADQLNFKLFQKQLENALTENTFKTYLMPITNRTGFHVFFPQIPERLILKTVKDYQNYISRLNAFYSYTNQHIELMKKGLEEGYILPKIVVQNIETALDPHIVESAEKSLLFKPFENLPEHFDEPTKKKLISDAKDAILSSVVTGYKEFKKFMLSDYTPACRESIAASDLPDGKTFYEFRVKKFTTLDVSPKEIHEIGHSEVKRIRSEMEEIIKSVNFKGDFNDFIHFLRTDKQFYVTEPEQLLKEIAFVLKKMDGQLPKLFTKLPKMPYGIKEIPPYIAPKTTTAYYSGPAGDGSRAGFYYVNTYDLKSRPLYEVEALSLHEAVPGHHLQIALQQELDNLPEFRRYSGFTAFVEGWGLYAERLGLETGFYQDPYNDFGRLTYEMWRACRLVVDTGIHYLGWTRQQAIDFMAANSASTIHNITTEVDRYIAWPGQALAYKMGELKIRELRKKAEVALGPNFDVRLFHDAILENGAIPLDILEAHMEKWIEEQKKNLIN